MQTPNIQDILTSPRAQAELARMSAILDNRNHQLHTTEQQLKKTVKGYRRLLGFVVLVVIALAAILGGAA